MVRIRWSSFITVSLMVFCLTVSMSGAFVPLAQADPGSRSPGVSMQLPFDCKETPEPQRPGDGLVGTIDRPVYGVGEPGSVYDMHSYAGLVWYNYDYCGFAGGIGGTLDTSMGNAVFNTAKLLVGTINWLHYLLADGGYVDQLDDLVQQGVRAMYTSIFTGFVGLAFLILAVVVLYRVRGGELADSTKRFAIAIVGLTLPSLAYLAPVTLSQIADELIIDQLQDLQDEIIGMGGSVSRDTLPTILVDEVIYQNWLWGEFGSSSAPKAEEFGRRLLLAQAFTKAEIATVEDASGLIAAKKADFETIASQLGEAYPYFTGEQSSRTGAAIYAFAQISAVGLLQLVAKLLAVVALIGLRLAVIMLPAIGLALILRPATLYEVARFILQLIFLAVGSGLVAAFHAWLFIQIYISDADGVLSIVILGIIEILVLSAMSPIRKLQGLIEGVRGPFGGNDSKKPSSWSKLRERLPGSKRDPERQSKWWKQVEDGRDPTTSGTVDVRRPENQDVPRPRRRPTDVARPEQRSSGRPSGSQQPADADRSDEGFRIYRSPRRQTGPDTPPRE